MTEGFSIRTHLRSGIAILVVVALGLFFFALRPVAPRPSAAVVFEVKRGEGLLEITKGLQAGGLLRSALAFDIFSVGDGIATSFHPGLYRLSPAMSGFAIAGTLATEPRAATVTIPEGWNTFQIDAALSDALVISKGNLVRFLASDARPMPEGYLFPDTYQFRNDETVSEIATTMVENFDVKARPAFGTHRATSTLSVASMLEKEARTVSDRRTIAGIIGKRIAAGIPLGIDAAVCYAKQLSRPDDLVDCAALTAADFKIDSPYNTYLHRGLPPGPIGNPGTSSIMAAENPLESPYWYYLSDPSTGKIVYAKTLSEQERNIRKYLRP